MHFTQFIHTRLHTQVVEATKQATAMQASLTKLQSDKDGLKRDLASVYARMKASEGQTAVVSEDLNKER